MSLSRRRLPSTATCILHLCGSVLEWVESFKYLCVFITNNFPQNDHIDGMCRKTRKVLGLLHRQLYRGSLPDAFRQLYLALVRPHLEYAAQLWDPHTRCNINKLEAVQRFALKMVTHRWDLSYNELLSIVGIPKLEKWRLCLKLILVFKIVLGLCYFPPGIIKQHVPYSERLARPHTLQCPYAHTNYHSFVPSSGRVWNSLE